MGVVAPDLPQIRAGGSMEDVESVAFGEHLCPVALDGNEMARDYLPEQ